jgi:ADP-ribose pyrophosphatase YjhB (NUDIX family)
MTMMMMMMGVDEALIRVQIGWQARGHQGGKQEERMKRGGHVVVFEFVLQDLITSKELEATKKLDKDARWARYKNIEERKVALEEKVSAKKMKE